MTSAVPSGVRIRFGIFGCEVVRKTRRAVAVMPLVLAISRPYNDKPRCALSLVHQVARVARFTGEGMPGGGKSGILARIAAVAAVTHQGLHSPGQSWQRPMRPANG